VQGLTLVNPSLGYGQDYIGISTSFTYAPPTSRQLSGKKHILIQ
jgi:hypothetical protein